MQRRSGLDVSRPPERPPLVLSFRVSEDGVDSAPVSSPRGPVAGRGPPCERPLSTARGTSAMEICYADGVMNSILPLGAAYWWKGAAMPGKLGVPSRAETSYGDTGAVRPPSQKLFEYRLQRNTLAVLTGIMGSSRLCGRGRLLALRMSQADLLRPSNRLTVQQFTGCSSARPEERGGQLELAVICGTNLQIGCRWGRIR